MSDDDPAANASDVSVGDESDTPETDGPDGLGATAADASGVHVVYVLECDDGTFYTGYTTDLERRVAEHEAGDGAKYTRGRAPLDVIHRETYDSRSAALSREHEIKGLSREAKEALVAAPDGDE